MMGTRVLSPHASCSMYWAILLRLYQLLNLSFLILRTYFGPPPHLGP